MGIPCGSEGRSCHHCPLSSRCGSRKGNTTSLVQQSYTASAFDVLFLFCFAQHRSCRMDRSKVHAVETSTYLTFFISKAFFAREFLSRCHLGVNPNSGGNNTPGLTRSTQDDDDK